MSLATGCLSTSKTALGARQGVPGAGLRVEGEKYFWYHHTSADTLDKLDPAEVQRCVAALAVFAYVVAEMPERLPR